MIDIQGLSLIITNKCNASCRHCGFDCCPDGEKTMEEKDAIFFIETAYKFSPIRSLCITGGEPFLYYDRVVNIMSCAAKLGLTSEIVTNSFWAYDYKTAVYLLSDLKKLGLCNFVTSFDDYHLEYIDAGNIRNAIKAACDLKLKVTIKTVEYNRCRINADNALLMLGLTKYKNSISVQSLIPINEGRFKYLNGHDKEDFISSPYSMSGGCSKIIKFPAINPSGELYPCCGFGGTARLAGKYPENDFKDMLSQMSCNLIFNLLAALGPLDLLRLASDYFPELSELSFNNPCEICNCLFNDKIARDAVYMVMKNIMERDIPGS